MSEEGQPEELPEVSEEVVGVTEESESEAGTDPGAEGEGLGFVMDVPLRLSVQIGGTDLLVREVLQLSKGSVVELDRMNGEPADVFVNERLVAKGEVSVVEDVLAVRITEVLGNEGVGCGER